MQRIAGMIHFTPEQESTFSVEGPVSPECALLTADAFSEVARKILVEQTECEDIGTRDEMLARQQKLARAVELALFASQIAEVCAPEIAQRLSIARNL